MSRNRASDQSKGWRSADQGRQRRWVRPTVFVLEDRMMLSANDYIVTTTSDSYTLNGQFQLEPVTGGLRWAITQLDENGGSNNTISFNISSGGQPQTITPITALPTITALVNIEGNTEPGFAGPPLIAIAGGSAGKDANGLTLVAGSLSSVIQSLVIDGFSGNGIEIDSSNDLVSGCYIGTDVTGKFPIPDDQGISVDSTGEGATIGGTSPAAANVISGNTGDGIAIEAVCLVEGNRIGTSLADTPLPNSVGIDVGALGAGVTIGGTSFGAGNAILGNSTDGVYIDAPCLVEGNTASGNGSDGIDVGALGAGATIGGTSTAAGNYIFGNSNDGVSIDAPCLVEGNMANNNGSDGIHVDIQGAGATVGGTSAGAGNNVSANSNDGVSIEAPCLVEGNTAVTNKSDGIDVDTQGAGATIGGTSAGAGNAIYENQDDGIEIFASCLVEGNDIGTNALGFSYLPNGNDGIYVGTYVGGSGATIGGTSAGTANIISGNGSDGIAITAACLVEGNRIGTNPAGTAAVANFVGISVGGSGATIGGTSAGAANVISGNERDGIAIAASCLVEGNLIGTDPGGTTAFANADGISVSGSGATIGGTSAGAANIISGNLTQGIEIFASCLVEGNRIGITAAGTALANSDGISVGGSGATIGGTTSGAANVISGNTYDGIIIGVSCLVEGNEIGTDSTGTNPVPNQGIGVFIVTGSAVATTIGVAGAGNTIAFNGGPGVATVPGTADSTIRFNSIFDNGGPGIDRNHDGVTANTPNGPNNTPVLTSVGDAIISGTLNASPDSSYIVDLYANPSSDASPAQPDGRAYLGSITVATNVQGNVGFIFSYTPIGGEPFVTATTTDASGTTSEFSAPVAYSVAASGLSFNATVGVPFQGTVASFTTTDMIATAADFTATINYGDGSPSAVGTVVAAPGGFVVVGSHTFTTAYPADPVTVTITDPFGSSQATADSLADITSPMTSFGQSVQFVAGTLYSAVVASFTDSSPLAVAGEFSAMINWGDKTASSAGTIAISGGGYSVTGLHTYNDDPVTAPVAYPVTVTITDALTGDTVTANATANVAPVPITVQAKNFAVTGGTPFSGTVATFSDGDARVNPAFYTATINWGDGTAANTTGTVTGTNPFTVTASHTFAPFPDTDLVTITITDKNGRTATGVDRVVNPPVAAESAPATTAGPAAEGPATTTGPAAQPATATTPDVLAIVADALALSPNEPFHGIVATFTDSGPPEPSSDYKAMINWGKGRKAAGMITGSNGRFVVSARHVFPRFSGQTTVTVMVTDAQGQVVSVSESASYAPRHPKLIKVANRAKNAVKSHH